MSKPSESMETDGNGCSVPSTPVLESPIDVVSMQPPEADTEPTRRVHFYNRVRITSGVGHTGKPRLDSPKQEGSQDSLQADSIDIPPRHDTSLPSEGSSTSASYSSSISAPLRSSTELPPRAASARFTGRRRKPLNNVLGSQDTNSWLHSLAIERRDRKNKRISLANEISPLLQVDGTPTTCITSPGVQQTTQENGHKPDDNEWPWKLFTLYVSTRLYGHRIWAYSDSLKVLGISDFSNLLL
jgi:hypothetical protein